ncbi:MAG: D-glycerate dehydrogenase [Anaerolineaceae bacterium]
MERLKIFVTRNIQDEGLDMLRATADVEVWMEELPPSKPILMEKVKGVQGIVSLLTDPIDAEVIDAAGPGLKVISQYAVGTDNIDLFYATERGIRVGYTPGVLTETTADLAWTLLMAAARRVVEADAYTRAGKWKTWGPRVLLGQDVSGATLGIIGMGRIGMAVARRAKGFGMKIIYYDEHRKNSIEEETGARYATLEEVYSQSDFISLHCPLTPETRGLIDDQAFSQMKPTAILINTARGPIVDQDALYRALATGKIWAAGIDVAVAEPLPMDSPLLTLDRLVITPHIASASFQTRTRMAVIAAENCLAGLKGEPLPFCANPEVERRDPSG